MEYTAVAHGLFKKIDYKKLYNDKTLVYDVKGILKNFNKNILRL